MARDLKLEVVLQAIDRATRPIRAITDSSSSLGRQLKDTREHLKSLEHLQRQATGFKKYQEELQGTGTELQQARDKLGAYQRAMEAHKATQQALGAEVNVHRRAVSNLQKALLSAKEPSAALNQQYLLARDRLTQLETGYRKSQSQLRSYKQDIANTTSTVQILNGKHQDQSQRLADLRTKLASAGISTDNLATHEQQLASGMEKANAAILAQQKRLAELTKHQESLNRVRAQYDRTQQLAGSMAGAGAASAATGAAMGAPVIGSLKSYIAFEDAMLGVAKQVEGARDDNGKLTATYYEMGDAIKAMSERIPMATTEIAALVEGGARMGIQGKDNLLKFAEVAANAATAFELPADQIGENLARIANLYKLPIQNIDQLGDAINYLDDNAQSKGSDIIDVMQRTAGATASVGMSFRDAAALGSTFLSLGASAEVAGTATTAMIRELAIAADQPKRFQKGLKAIGLDAAAIQADMTKDATGTIQKVLEAINQLPKEQQTTVTTQLFGKDYGDDAAKLANNIGEYRRQLELANAASGKGSMQREADIRADAMSSRLEMAQNRLFNLSSSLGETLRPTLVELLEGFGSIVGSISAWVKENPVLTGQILKTVAGVAALAAGFGAVALAMAGFLGPFAMVRFGLMVFGIKGGGVVKALLGIGSAADGGAGRFVLLRKALGGVTSAFGVLAKAGTGLWSRLSLLAIRVGLLRDAFFRALPAILGAAKAFGTGLLQALLMPLRLLMGGLGRLAIFLVSNIPAALAVVGRAFLILGRTLLMNPIGLAITAIAGAAYLIYANWDKLGPYFQGMWAEIKAGFSGGIGGIVTTLMNFNPVGLVYRAFAEVLNYLGLDLPVKFTEFGNMIVRGLVNGLLAGLGQIKGAITQVGSATIGWFKEKLGIHSPSRVFAELGGFTMAGLTQGLAGGEKDALAQVTDTAKKLTQAGDLSLEVKTNATAAKGIAEQAAPLTHREAANQSAAISTPAPVQALADQATTRSDSGLLEQVANVAKRLMQAGGAALTPPATAAKQLAEPAITSTPAPVQALADQATPRSDSGLLEQVVSAAKQLTRAGVVALGAAAGIPAMAAQGPAFSQAEPLRIDNRAPLGAARPAPTSAQPLPPITVQVYSAPGMSEQQLAQLVGQKVSEALAQAARAKQVRARSSLSDQD